MTKEELLEKAHRDYPIGTMYYNASRPNYKISVLVKKRLKYYNKVGGKPMITDGCGGSVYFNGRWAEIINSSEQKIIYNYLIL